MFFDETDVKTKTTKLVESTATADMLVYEDGKRLATYTTGPSAKAHLFGTQGDLTGDTIKLFLKESSNELERAEADGHVVLKDERKSHRDRRPFTTTFYMTVGLTSPDPGRVFSTATTSPTIRCIVRARKGIGYCRRSRRSSAA